MKLAILLVPSHIARFSHEQIDPITSNPNDLELARGSSPDSHASKLGL